MDAVSVPPRLPSKVRQLLRLHRNGFPGAVRDELASTIGRSIRKGRVDVAARCALVLARHDVGRGRPEAGLAWASQVVSVTTETPLLVEAQLLTVDALTSLGRTGDAEALLTRLPDDLPERRIRLANLHAARGDLGAALEVHNAAWEAGGLQRIDVADGPLPLLHRLRRTRDEVVEGPLVTVLVPCFEAEGTIDIALRSLAEQTYRNLEIVVVDDASTDRSVEVVERWAEEDRRIRLLRQPERRGAYAARNLGLSRATGRWVRVHDADDWTHPDAIARQVVPLLAGEARWSATRSIRTTGELLCPPTQPGGHRRTHRLRDCYPSFLHPREALGVGWPDLPVNADMVALEVLAPRLGGRPHVVLPDVPLSFQLTGEGLTSRSGPGHLDGRRTPNGYRWLVEADLARTLSTDPDVPPADAVRLAALHDLPQEVRLDVLHAIPFHPVDTPERDRTLGRIVAGARDGSHGVTNLPDASARRPQRMDPAVLRALRDHAELGIVFAGQRVEVDTVVVHDPASLVRLPDWLPEVHARRVVVESGGRSEEHADDLRAAVARLAPGATFEMRGER